MSEADAPAPHVYVLRRVGNVLLIYFALHLMSALADLLLRQSHSFSLDLLTLILGLMLRRGSLGAARFTTFVYALAIVCCVGALVMLGVLLVLGVVPVPPGWNARDLLTLAWGGFWCVAELGLFAWILRELRDPLVEEALANARRGSNRAMLFWGGGVGLGVASLLIPLVLLLVNLQKQLTPQVATVVEKKLGPGWQLELRNVVKMSNGHWKANVVAHKGNEVRALEVSDADQ